MDRIDIKMKDVEASTEARALRASWTRETFGDLKIDFKSYSIESVFRALNRVGKIKELYGIGD
jgi:hypothetical protein